MYELKLGIYHPTKSNYVCRIQRIPNMQESLLSKHRKVLLPVVTGETDYWDYGTSFGWSLLMHTQKLQALSLKHSEAKCESMITILL